MAPAAALDERKEDRQLVLMSQGPDLSRVRDPGRLAKLDGYAVLDTEPEESFDGIVRLACRLCSVPVALVSLVDRDRQWFKARIGFPHCETDLNSSVCAYGLQEPDLLVISDLTADPRTLDNPLVTGEPFIRFYAGAPLRTSDGFVLGSLCVIDTVPRPSGLTVEQADDLRALSNQVCSLLEMRRAIVRQRAAEEALQADESRLRALMTAVSYSVYRMSPDWQEMRQLDGANFLADTTRPSVRWLDLYIDPTDRPGVLSAIEDAIRRKDTFELEHRVRRADGSIGWTLSRAVPILDRHGAITEWFGAASDVSDRHAAQHRRDLLLRIGDLLRDAEDKGALVAGASEIIGNGLGLARVGYGETDREGDLIIVESDWSCPGLTSIAGPHLLCDYGRYGGALRRGETVAIDDVTTDSRTAASADMLLAVQTRALVNIPIMERGRFVGLFFALCGNPRSWSDEEIIFLRNACDRIRAAVARVEAEADQRVLNEELSHRLKNTLAMVQSIATQTLRAVPERVPVEAFEKRLHALASAHDVLLQQSWSTAPMREVIRTVLRGTGQTDRIDVAGPPIDLGPRATMSLSLLLHELATNAAKYGALSNETGRVSLSWHIEGAADDAVVEMIWREAGGPSVQEPSGHKGFGSRLIRLGLVGAGGTNLRYRPEGFEADLRAPLAHLQRS